MLFRKKLITDISAVEIRNVTERLKENKIAYEVTVKSVRQFIGRMTDLQQGLHYGKSPSNPMDIVTTVYVKPRDYVRAKQLIN